MLLEEITPRPSQTSDNETVAVPICEVPVSIITEYDPDNLEPEPVDDPSPRPVPAPYRSTRRHAGQHSNPYHEPRSS